MGTQTETPGLGGLRADARRNHERILAAAGEVFLERGSGVALEEIAQRAGVGIGTLYRRFATRETLMRAVILEALTGTRAAAERALAEEDDAFDALARYMHAALQLRVSALIPVLMEKVDMDDERLRPTREASAHAVGQIIEAAHADGSLAGEVTFGDIGTLLVRLARPLPGPISRELNDRLAHRHLDLLIDGIRPRADRRRPAGDVGLTLGDLRRLADDEAADAQAGASGLAGAPE